MNDFSSANDDFEPAYAAKLEEAATCALLTLAVVEAMGEGAGEFAPEDVAEHLTSDQALVGLYYVTDRLIQVVEAQHLDTWIEKVVPGHSQDALREQVREISGRLHLRAAISGRMPVEVVTHSAQILTAALSEDPRANLLDVAYTCDGDIIGADAALHAFLLAFRVFVIGIANEVPSGVVSMFEAIRSIALTELSDALQVA